MLYICWCVCVVSWSILVSWDNDVQRRTMSVQRVCSFEYTQQEIAVPIYNNSYPLHQQSKQP